MKDFNTPAFEDGIYGDTANLPNIGQPIKTKAGKKTPSTEASNYEQDILSAPIRLPAPSRAERTVGKSNEWRGTGQLVIGSDDECLMLVESDLEMKVARLLSTRADLTDLQEQVCFPWQNDNGKRVEHFFDFVFTSLDGKRYAIIVKEVSRLSSSRLQREITLISSQAVCGFVDRVVVMTQRDIDPIDLHNAKLLHAVQEYEPEVDMLAKEAVSDLVGSVMRRRFTINQPKIKRFVRLQALSLIKRLHVLKTKRGPNPAPRASSFRRSKMMNRDQKTFVQNVVKGLRQLYVETERNGSFKDQLDRLIEPTSVKNATGRPVQFTTTGETRGIILVDGAGGGKTSLVNKTLRQHEALQQTSDAHRPWISVSVPSPATLKSLGCAILAESGYPILGQSKRVWDIWNIVRQRLQMLGTVVLWIDEAHDLFHTGHSDAKREVESTLRMLKSIMQGDGAVIVVLSGVETLWQIASCDDQVRRRYSKIELPQVTRAVHGDQLTNVYNGYCAALGATPCRRIAYRMDLCQPRSVWPLRRIYYPWCRSGPIAQT